jgi:hypothetical protein
LVLEEQVLAEHPTAIYFYLEWTNLENQEFGLGDSSLLAVNNYKN